MLRLCWRLSDPRLRRILLVIYATAIAGNLVSLVEPLIVGRIVSAIAAGHDLFRTVPFWLVLWVGNTIVFWIFWGPSRIMERRYAYQVRERLVERLFREVTHLPWSWHQNHHSGETIGRIDLASQAVNEFAGTQYLYIQLTIRMLGSVVMLSVISPLSGLLLAVALPLLTIVFTGFDRRIAALAAEQNVAETHLTAGLFDYLSNIATILTLRLQAASSREVARRFAGIKPPLYRGIYVNETKYLYFGICIRVITGMALMCFVWQNRHSTVANLAGTAVVIVQYLNSVSSSFFACATAFQSLIKFVSNIAGLREIDEAFARQQHVMAASLPDWSRVEIRGLRFRYQDQEQHVHQLSNVALTLPRGGRIAFVGPSGSGKSTLLRLLRGLHAPDEATLSIDGHETPFGTLANVSSLVPQDAEIFENTILYNLDCGTDIDDADLARAIHVACLQPVIDMLPRGLETDIRERGVNLSGGQKQRLALARGLLAARDSSLLLLDEPTSSLDSVTEAQVFERLLADRRDACVVASLHRLHLLERFDHVYVLENGRVAEQGSFRDLIAQDGLLARLWQAQQKEEETSAGGTGT